MAERKVSSIKAVKAIEDENEESKMIEVEYEDEVYTYERKKLNSARLLQATDDNKLTVILRILIGDKQYEKFMGEDRDIEEMNEFAQALFEAAGTTPGE